ncbi:DMT family transporter [Ovoidimarina sediminis]|uniref:DMT family transporter n=1 Tax=Ovoidimarina sediminis TaxID=3079856 RepID=UPI002913C25F|nr:DMT family transporter [Rhodophyticola sp. MJ-SS7]MDU8945640.1 DMT family transporter [Rhodophyticola sp. MJ-SS7]
MPPAVGYASIMFLAGVGIPLLAALNAALGVRVGSPAAAAVVLFLVALLTALGAMLLTGGTRAIATLPAQPKHLFLAGLLIAFYVLTITWIAPRFGVGNAVFFVLLGQLVAAALIDHYALFGSRQATLTPLRAAGIALMAVGVLLARRP